MSLSRIYRSSFLSDADFLNMPPSHIIMVQTALLLKIHLKSEYRVTSPPCFTTYGKSCCSKKRKRSVASSARLTGRSATNNPVVPSP